MKLGIAYELGQGVLQSNDDAARWFSKSAAQGNALAQYNLGIMAEYGVAGAIDDVQACVWFSLAANRGEKVAMELRNALEKSMTPEQVAEIKQRVATWKPSGADVR